MSARLISTTVAVILSSGAGYFPSYAKHLPGMYSYRMLRDGAFRPWYTTISTGYYTSNLKKV